VLLCAPRDHWCEVRVVTQVTEHFNVKPGDGFIYFTLKPPWVKTNTAVYTPPTR
jgi:hypothetical protein